MQDTSSKQESDYDIFRYLNFNPDTNDQPPNNAILPIDLNHYTINSLLENNNEEYPSSKSHCTAIDEFETTNLRNFAETFGIPAFGNKSEAVKEAYSNWTLNDDFNEPKTNLNKCQLNPLYKRFDEIEHDSWEIAKKYQNQFPHQTNTEYAYPSFYDSSSTCADYNYYFPNNECNHQENYMSNNSNLTSISHETFEGNSILSKLLGTPTTTTSTNEPLTFCLSPSLIDSSQSSLSTFQSQSDFSQQSQSSESTLASLSSSLSFSQSDTYSDRSSSEPQFQLLELPCYNMHTLSRAKCISCTQYFRSSEETTRDESGLIDTNFQQIIPLQVMPVRQENQSSLYFIPVPKAMPFTAIHTYFPNAPRPPKRYITVREMIEERDRHKSVQRAAACGKSERLKRKLTEKIAGNANKTIKTAELETTKLNDNCQLVVSDNVTTVKCKPSEPNAQNICKSDDQNATTLLCLLPVTGQKNDSNSKVIPPIVITDFQNGKVNAKEHKPKHFEMKTLTIGSFQIEAQTYANRKSRNKVKVVFSKRTFIYEFESQTDNSPTKMISIEVSFQSLVAIRCFGRLLQLRVKKQPIMYEGVIKPRHGIVSKTPVYNKKNPIDLSNGQLAVYPVHKIMLKRSQSNWLRESLIRFDPWFHALFATPIGDECAKQTLLPNNYQDWESTCKSLRRKRMEDNDQLKEPATKRPNSMVPITVCDNKK